ncbi:unnamed protein product, partial [Rotaria sp. Silwood2]
FFTFDELSTNIYPYKQNFDKIMDDFFDILKKIKRINEPTIISLNTTGKVSNKKEENLLKSTKEQHTKSIVVDHKKLKSPVSQENTITTSDDTRIVRYIINRRIMRSSSLRGTR